MILNLTAFLLAALKDGSAPAGAATRYTWIGQGVIKEETETVLMQPCDGCTYSSAAVMLRFIHQSVTSLTRERQVRLPAPRAGKYFFCHLHGRTDLLHEVPGLLTKAIALTSAHMANKW